ncbi:MAG: AtpZ/AtpI family protein [Spirochaetota bacterium]
MGDGEFRERENREFGERVSRSERRKLRSREQEGGGIWFGLGMFGIIGWSVAVPTLIGLAAGIWMDHRWPGEFSWTLTLMSAGLLVGGFIAYTWVKGEQQRIQRETEHHRTEDDHA